MFLGSVTAEAAADFDSSYNCQVKLFNIIPIKTVNVSVSPQMYVIPSGEAIGIKIYTDGVLVVGIGDVHSTDGNVLQPAKDSGIETGDRIIEVNGNAVLSAQDFCKKINVCGGSARLTVMRNNQRLTLKIEAVYSKESDCYKVGLWVRDSTAGIGTLTFYNPENSTYGALGHAICDSDTQEILTVRRGSVNLCDIIDVHKGEKGTPGELIGNFQNSELGEINTNSPIGIYGNADNIPAKNKVAVASRFQIKEGKAYILCDVDGKGAAPYEIVITKIAKSALSSNKNFVIKVTDERLIEKTGGIVQGMSGSPILQNNMLVGAVTHVFVNEPKKGYGVFAENMLDEAMKVN